MPYILGMYTIVETPTFIADAKSIWTEDERGAFCAWLSVNPEAGDVIGFVAQIKFELGFSLTPYLSKDTLSRWRTQMSETV